MVRADNCKTARSPSTERCARNGQCVAAPLYVRRAVRRETDPRTFRAELGTLERSRLVGPPDWQGAGILIIEDYCLLVCDAV
jgi:hypothetical protein